ncbi:hypothetical protein SLA2020_225220 [Shorea laevis]
MLQRAASNAYSWWLASHIRTKQSKWLEQSLQDMEEKVASMLKLIEEDGDSFRKRAEMYYKKRPELINFVEETYRAYRALAERYDHISTELQNANNTLASCFPDQVAFSDDEDDYASPKVPRRPPERLKPSNIPKVPEGSPKDLKGLITSATKKLQPSKAAKAVPTSSLPKSGISKEEGLAKIDKLQKQILILQTEKEFMKSSYESGLAKYWEIDKEIVQMQNKIGNLQDEFGAGNVIEDDEARTLMSAAALKSCQETLAKLQEKHERLVEEAEVECKRIKDARQKLRSVKQEVLPDEVGQEKPPVEDEPVKALEKLESTDQEGSRVSQDMKDVETLHEKRREHSEVEFSEALDVSGMVEKIDELVNKVVSLETAISSQTVLMHRLRTESHELQVQIQTLEDDKATLIDDKNNLSKKLKEKEEKLWELQDLNQNLKGQNNNLQRHFTEAQCNLEHLSEKLQGVKLNVELEVTGALTGKKSSQVEAKPNREMNPSDDFKKPDSVISNEELKVVQVEEELKAPAEVISQKDEQENGKKPTNSHDNEQVVKVEEEVLVPVEAKSQNEIDEQECLKDPTDGSEKVQVLKAEEDVNIVGSLKKEKESLVEVGSTTGIKVGQGNLKQDDVSTKGLDVNIERKDITSRSYGEGAHTGLHRRSKGYQEVILQDNIDWQAPSFQVVSPVFSESGEQETMEEDEPNWKQMFLNGVEGREKTLLGEYTSVLRSLKEMKRKFSELETNNQNNIFEFTLQLKELKSSNAKKDEEIRSLRKKLSLSPVGASENNHLDHHQFKDNQPVDPAVTSERAAVTETIILLPGEKEVKEETKLIFIDQAQTISPIEEKLRMSIDELLEENLDFWLRFSTSFGHIKKFETSMKDLLSEVSKLEERKRQEGSSTGKYFLKSDARPIYKHLREIQTELTVWLEKSVILNEELKNRFSSLCDIQEEITRDLKNSAEDDDFKFTSYQAAKFQGEVLNMKQENNKVADELQAGIDHITTLQLEVERTLAKLNEDFGLSETKNHLDQLQHSESRSRVPLRSFIFGVKAKKQKNKILSCVPPALNKKYNELKSGYK